MGDKFQTFTDDVRALAYFEALKIDVSEACALYRLIGTDMSGSVEIEEFVSGFRKLGGESRASDVAFLRFELQWLMKNFDAFVESVETALTGKKSFVAGSL